MNTHTIESVTAMESIEELRDAATSLELKYSGNTGIDTLRTKILTYLNETSTQEIDFGGHDEEIEIAPPLQKEKMVTTAQLIAMDASLEKNPNVRRQIIRAQALRLMRVKITNLDPNDSVLSGAIISVQSKYTGKVAKYVPFGEESENGYHIPKIIYDHLKTQKFVLRKEVKGGRFGVKTYKTTMVNKFLIEDLDPLSRSDIQELASHQRAAQSIDN